jgi:hypothetical protein
MLTSTNPAMRQMVMNGLLATQRPRIPAPYLPPITGLLGGRASVPPAIAGLLPAPGTSGQ